MSRNITQWHSPRLNKSMEICVYGTFGVPILMFPSAAADYLEYERFHLIDSVQQFIDVGIVKLYSINSINSESWLNHSMSGRDKAIRHQQYNAYITDEVVPFIQDTSGGPLPILTAGVSLGAFHAVNSLFRRPDLFDGVLAMSGVYDLHAYSKGYFDEDCYFNSPMDYLPNLSDDSILTMLRSKKHIHIATGSGAYEGASASMALGAVLHAKGIPHTLDVWTQDYTHDWPTWRAMLPALIEQRVACSE